ncbi:putative Mn2+ efflux pump MntP [Marmoricola sp. URHA0025 HA25]
MLPSSNKTRLAAAAVATLMTVSLAACGSSSDGSAPAASSQSSTAALSGAAATATPAAELRAGLTHLLTQHVYLAGIALKTAVDKGGNLKDPGVTAAVTALDDNSVALSKAVGAAYPDAEKPFLESWRQHIGFFVDYTLGKATKNQAMVDKATSDLDGYRTSFGELIHSVVPELPADAVAKELVPHVASLEAYIDSLVAGDGHAFARLVTAADHMPMTADTLAGGIARNAKLSGDPDSPASGLRSGLTYLLDSHVDLAGIALAQAVSKGGNLEDPSVKAAVAALDGNSVALSKAVGSAYPDAEQPFLESWRQHIGFFVSYTLGKATKDQAMADKATSDLDGYRTSFGELIHSVVPQLPSAAVAKELVPHVQTVLTTIDSLVAGDGMVFMDLSMAADHMPMTAKTLAGGIADNKKLG